MFCESTAKSASLPGSIVPLLSSANSAYAAVRVKAITACSRVRDSLLLSRLDDLVACVSKKEH